MSKLDVVKNTVDDNVGYYVDGRLIVQSEENTDINVVRLIVKAFDSYCDLKMKTISIEKYNDYKCKYPDKLTDIF